MVCSFKRSMLRRPSARSSERIISCCVIPEGSVGFGTGDSEQPASTSRARTTTAWRARETENIVPYLALCLKSTTAAGSAGGAYAEAQTRGLARMTSSLRAFDVRRQLDSRSVAKDDDGDRRTGGELPPHRDDALSAPRFTDLDAVDCEDAVATDEERLAVDGGFQGSGPQTRFLRW